MGATAEGMADMAEEVTMADMEVDMEGVIMAEEGITAEGVTTAEEVTTEAGDASVAL
jgi:hypothetical protein